MPKLRCTIWFSCDTKLTVDTLSDYSILFSIHVLFFLYCFFILLAWVFQGPSKDSHIEIFICTLKIPIYLNTETFTTINSSFFPPKRKRKSKRLSPPQFLKSSSLSHKHCQQNLFYFIYLKFWMHTYPAPLTTYLISQAPTHWTGL